MMRVLGIDPGRRGALALVDVDGRIVIGARAMPVVIIDRYTIPDLDTIVAWLAELGGADRLAIERQWARGGQETAGRNSPSAAFQAGAGYGALLALTRRLGLPVSLVAPASWQAAAGLRGAVKAAAIDAAITACGSSASAALAMRSREIAIAIAEAVLIALHA